MDLILSSPPPPKRIVLLIDLHPLLKKPDPGNPHYISQTLTSIRKILDFSPLYSSLFAFKLFVSSLSPILSASKLRSPHLLSFQRPAQTLASLSQTLASLDLAVQIDASLAPQASFVTKFLIQLEHDYSWDPDSEDSKGIVESLTFPSNLVLLFSPIYGNRWGLESLDFDGFLGEFCRVFGPVKEKLVNKSIHFCWIGVNFEAEGLKVGFFENGVRELGWGFCSADAIVLGSALVPLGLIFPYIGCRFGVNCNNSVKKGKAELVLGITDVNGKLLECKSCNVEVTLLKTRERLDFDGDFVKIRINEVWRRHERENLIENSTGVFLLRGISGECRNDTGNLKGESVVDKVLELLCIEYGETEFIIEKPIWQIILAFLFRRNYWASVSILVSDGNSFQGILKPFTVNYAVLCIIEKNTLVSYQLAGKGSSETFDSPSKTKDIKRNKHKMHKNLIQDATWSSFYESAFRQKDDCALEIDLEEIYFAAETSKSKKLQFLRCWMRQMKKSIECCQMKHNELEKHPNVDEEVKERFEGLQQELESHGSFSPVREANHSLAINQEASSVSCLEDFEGFLRTIPQKIEHGICSKEVDLWILAERLVEWSIDALYAKLGRNANKDSVGNEVDYASGVNISLEVSHILLQKPKDLMLKYKLPKSATVNSDKSSANCCIENLIREHELQILFRMELLRSKIAPSLGENVKQKMVKEICVLLQSIEFYLQGDFLCGESLIEFAGRVIKFRYAPSLGDIIHKIYNQMEFLSYDGDEIETSDSLPCSNSEPDRDNNESGNALKDAFGPADRDIQRDDGKERQFAANNAHDERLMKAQKRRDSARRFSSFTSWVPDLHRVWALKQPRMEKSMLKSFTKSKPKRTKRHRNSDIVYETPMTKKEHLHRQEDDSRESANTSSNGNSCRLLSKALFQHEGDLGSDNIP